MNNPVNSPAIDCFSSIELHMGAYNDFVKKFGARVRKAGGRYNACRGIGDKRYVTIPTTHLELINDVLWNIHGIEVLMLRGANQEVRDRLGDKHTTDCTIHLPKSVISVLASTPQTRPTVVINQFLDVRLNTPGQVAMAQEARRLREAKTAELMLARAAAARLAALQQAAPALLDALRVVALGHRHYLECNDPKALQQAMAAINAATGELVELPA